MYYTFFIHGMFEVLSHSLVVSLFIERNFEEAIRNVQNLVNRVIAAKPLLMLISQSELNTVETYHPECDILARMPVVFL